MQLKIIIICFCYAISLSSMSHDDDTYENLSAHDLSNTYFSKNLHLAYSIFALYTLVTDVSAILSADNDDGIYMAATMLSTFIYAYVLSKIISSTGNNTLLLAKRYYPKDRIVYKYEKEFLSLLYFLENKLKAEICAYGIKYVADYVYVPKVNAKNTYIVNENNCHCSVISNTKITCCKNHNNNNCKTITINQNDSLKYNYFFDSHNFWRENTHNCTALKSNTNKNELILKNIYQEITAAVAKYQDQAEPDNELGKTISLYQNENIIFYDYMKKIWSCFKMDYFKNLSVKIGFNRYDDNVENDNFIAAIVYNSEHIKSTLYLSYDQKMIEEDLPAVLGHEFAHIKQRMHYLYKPCRWYYFRPINKDDFIGPEFPKNQLITWLRNNNIELNADLYSIIIDPNHALSILRQKLKSKHAFTIENSQDYCSRFDDFINDKEKNPYTSHPDIYKCRSFMALMWMEKLIELYKIN